jgi:hypothetical protein
MTPSGGSKLIGDTDQQAYETVRFGVDGRAYEIDLSARHASELRSMAGRYIVVARKKQQARSRRTRQPQHQLRPRETAKSGRATGQGPSDRPSGRKGAPRDAQHEPAASESAAVIEAQVRGGEHDLTDREKQELRTIADTAKPQQIMVAGRLRTKGLADRDTAGNWWLTDAGRRQLISA